MSWQQYRNNLTILQEIDNGDGTRRAYCRTKTYGDLWMCDCSDYHKPQPQTPPDCPHILAAKDVQTNDRLFEQPKYLVLLTVVGTELVIGGYLAKSLKEAEEFVALAGKARPCGAEIAEVLGLNNFPTSQVLDADRIDELIKQLPTNPRRAQA
jgi:hypothetical protein